jgi:hypothetical protein
MRVLHCERELTGRPQSVLVRGILVTSSRPPSSRVPDMCLSTHDSRAKSPSLFYLYLATNLAPIDHTETLDASNSRLTR